MRPRTLADRDERLNNMLVESWVWNIAKSNFSPKDYERMIREIDRIEIPEELYKLQSLPVSLNESLPNDQSGEPFDDIEDG